MLRKFDITVILDSAFARAINDSYKFPFPELKSAIKSNPICMANSVENTFQRLYNGRAITFAKIDSEMYFEYYKRCGFSRFWMARI